MKLWHHTNAAAAVLRGGFQDAEGLYMTPICCGGCASQTDVSTLTKARTATPRPRSPGERRGGIRVVEDERPYREFLVPADVLNEYGPPRVVSDEAASDV